jgi:hypothetical protein
MASSGQLYLAWQAHQMNERGQAEIERKREAETGGWGKKHCKIFALKLVGSYGQSLYFHCFVFSSFFLKHRVCSVLAFASSSEILWYLICIIMCCLCFPYSYISVQLFISLSLDLCTVILQFFLLLYSFQSALFFRISLVLLSLDILLNSIN